MNNKGIIGFVALFGMAASVQSAEYQTLEQRLGYTMGFQYGQVVKSQGVSIDSAAFAAALKDVLQGKPPQMKIEAMNATLGEAKNNLLKAKKAQAGVALEEGKHFLQENKGKEGVVTLPSGLQYLERKAGSGDSPKMSDKVTVHYEGKLTSGQVFDSSFRRGEPATFPLGGVIPGFREALSLMKPGAKWQVVIPAELGYGQSGAPGSIGPNEVLIFELELISIAAK
ncbi:MAG: FKBP-type peptidyl-prolyl cis-trans isomerase [Candidatus Sedimenticola sp. (ex Thyasira tokunagai)]